MQSTMLGFAASAEQWPQGAAVPSEGQAAWVWSPVLSHIANTPPDLEQRKGYPEKQLPSLDMAVADVCVEHSTIGGGGGGDGGGD